MLQTAQIEIGERRYRFLDLRAVFGETLSRLPFVFRLLIENHVRTTAGEDIDGLTMAIEDWLRGRATSFELSFRPNRLLMHDTTCTPALADIAGLKDALAELGGNPAQLSPSLPVEVSVDHSLSVDHFARADALSRDSVAEFERNAERYAFMKWASQSMRNLRVNPPGTGIMHTINLEQLASVLETSRSDGGNINAHPDMLLGTDSHTPMVNRIGVLGWGVGGLEAESVMFGQSVSLALPNIVGVRLSGQLPSETLSTDLALVVTNRLRELGVTGDFVEFFGPGVSTLSADDRAVVANMAPEYGATTGYFPIDDRTIAYLERTGRPAELVTAIPLVLKKMGLWFDPDLRPAFSREIEIDLGQVMPSLAGPRRPQDRLAPSDARRAVETALGRKLSVGSGGEELPDGAVGVAAITSCTNTSDPRLLIAAGLLARNARRAGLSAKPWVKTSLAPGSPSAQESLARAGLLDDLGAVGFDIVGFGCTTCIGNSGPLLQETQAALNDGKAVAAVISGNRNFPGRVHPRLNLGFLASPPMVVAYALQGHINSDILSEPVADDRHGGPVFLKDIWPTVAEVEAAMTEGFRTEDVRAAFDRATASPAWKSLDAAVGDRYPWDPASRYLTRPKFTSVDETCRLGAYEAAPLLVLGDDMTTDHISPAGAIDADSEAGQWLIERGGDPGDLNVFAAYRGNWEVMLRGLFTNRLVKNYLAEDVAPGETRMDGADEALPLWRAAEAYQMQDRPTVIFAGELYGMGSSRDWAAKGVALLGGRAVIARSFERIHRTNLIGMGILPIKITDDFVPVSAGLRASDRVIVDMPAEALEIRKAFEVEILSVTGNSGKISVRADVETLQELETLKVGGILPKILKSKIPPPRA